MTDRVATPKGKYINPECSKVASRYYSPLPLSIITIGTWLDDRILSLCGERPIGANAIQFHQSYADEGIRMCPYDGIRRRFLGIYNGDAFYLVAGILRFHGATWWIVWALSADQQIHHVVNVCRGLIDVSYPHGGMDVIWLSDCPNLVKEVSYWLSDSPNWVWQLRDSLSELILTHDGNCSGRTVWAGDYVGLPWYNSKNTRVDLQSIRLLALQPHCELKRWQWTGHAIRYSPGMYLNHG